MTARSARKGLTLVEMLVVLSIIAIVIMITVPAVMSARETARRTQCLNNLKQVALAINAHLDQKSFYPREEKAYSAFVHLLPFLEQASLYNSINMTASRRKESSRFANSTAFSTNITTFVCPSDNEPVGQFAPITYAGNVGTGFGKYGRPENGPFASSLLDPKIRDSLVRDGLANTIAVSEYCRTWGPNSSHPIYQLDNYNESQAGFNQMIADCNAAGTSLLSNPPKRRGECWAFSDMNNTTYDHNIVPNGKTCFAEGGRLGAWTASSNHRNGVNVAHLDGHVSFVTELISTETWRSLGTMDGGEITATIE